MLTNCTGLHIFSAARIFALSALTAACLLLFTLPASADTLTVTHTPPPDTSFQQGTADIISDVLDLSASAGDGITLSSLSVYQIGSASDSDITLVKLIDDTNADGVIDEGESTIASTTFSGGVATFSSLGYSIPASSTQRIIVCFSVNNLAKIGASIQVNIASADDITLAGGDEIAPETSALMPLAGCLVAPILDKPDTLTISQTAVDGGDVMLGATDHVIQVLDLSVNEDQVSLLGLSIDRIGTVVDSDTPAGGIKLWYDADNNGTISLPDWQLSSSATFSNGTVTFPDIKAMNISGGSPKRLLVSASTRLDAIIDRTLGSSIDTTASVSVGSPDIAELSSTPLSSLTHTLAPRSPSAPTGITVTANKDKQFSLDWSDNNASEHITKYRVFRAVSGDDYAYIGEISNSDYIDNVDVRGDYSYKISSVNKSGESVRSAPAQAEAVDIDITVPSLGETATVNSADGSIEVSIPAVYGGKHFTVNSQARPTGLQIVSDYYYTFTIDAEPPFNPPISITLRCDSNVTAETKIFHFSSQGKWVELKEGAEYIGKYTRNGKHISYDGVTEFSGYAAADLTSVGGYNYPIINTDTPSGPHGQYTSASKKCKDCHAGHRALGMYRITRSDSRSEACSFCHGIGGAASKTVVLDAEGHGIGEDELGKPVIAPGDTDPAFSTSSTMWGCLECHSVHNNQVITLSDLSSDKLLKADPNPGKTYLYYVPEVGESSQTVSKWCSSCHNANFGAAGDIQDKIMAMGALTGRVAGHPSSESGTTTDTSGNILVELDDSENNGPTCRECHPSDGGNASVIAKFPHTSGSTPSMLKAGSGSMQVDNVCVDCHQTPSLN